jgi:hypothetical protein
MAMRQRLKYQYFAACQMSEVSLAFVATSLLFFLKRCCSRRCWPSFSRTFDASRSSMRNYNRACNLLREQRSELPPVCENGIREVSLLPPSELDFAALGFTMLRFASPCFFVLIYSHRWGLLPDCVLTVNHASCVCACSCYINILLSTSHSYRCLGC